LLVDQTSNFCVALYSSRRLRCGTEKIRIATKIEIADEHAAEMADVADFIAAEAKGAEKVMPPFRPHPFHFDRNGIG